MVRDVERPEPGNGDPVPSYQRGLDPGEKCLQRSAACALVRFAPLAILPIMSRLFNWLLQCPPLISKPETGVNRRAAQHVPFRTGVLDRLASGLLRCNQIIVVLLPDHLYSALNRYPLSPAIHPRSKA